MVQMSDLGYLIRGISMERKEKQWLGCAADYKPSLSLEGS